MSQLRFQHVFFALMAISTLTAFVIPPRFTNRVHPQLAALFAPVARPAGSVASWVQARVAPEPIHDRRSSDAVREENMELKVAVQTLTLQLKDLRERDAERGKLGSLRDICTPWSVIGFDAGSRDSLLLRGSTLEGLHEGMHVLYPGGVVGQIERCGLAGAQIRLISDVGFRLRASFGSFQRRPDNTIEFVRLDAPPAVVEGVGRNTMSIQGLSFEQVKGKVAVGNWVILTEPDWPPYLQGQPLGKVVRITPRQAAPLFADIRIEPQTNLSKLREVMVVTREK